MCSSDLRGAGVPRRHRLAGGEGAGQHGHPARGVDRDQGGIRVRADQIARTGGQGRLGAGDVEHGARSDAQAPAVRRGDAGDGGGGAGRVDGHLDGPDPAVRQPPGEEVAGDPYRLRNQPGSITADDVYAWFEQSYLGVGD